MKNAFFEACKLLKIRRLKTYTDLKEFSMEHPRKLRTFADKISPVGVTAAFFSMSDSSQKLSTAPGTR